MKIGRFRLWPPRFLRNIFINFRVLDAKLDRVLAATARLETKGDDIMAAIDDAAAAVQSRVGVLEGKINETIGTLGELKVLVQNGQNTGNAEAVLAQVATKLDEITANLSTAETDADPTPDTPPTPPQ